MGTMVRWGGRAGAVCRPGLPGIKIDDAHPRSSQIVEPVFTYVQVMLWIARLHGKARWCVVYGLFHERAGDSRPPGVEINAAPVLFQKLERPVMEKIHARVLQNM